MALFRLIQKSRLAAPEVLVCISSRVVSTQQEKLSMFFNDEVQSLLQSLTRLDLNKVFRRKKDGSKLETPEYVFMTTADLEHARTQALEKAKKKLQMPPVLPPANDGAVFLIVDERLKGMTENNFVFTDISFGKNDKSRTIVVREPNGKLRFASLSERSRMNEVYFPRPGRKIFVPTMFEDKNIKALLDKKEYEFILDRACAQFEPEDPQFIEICHKTYECVNSNGDFNILRSTRHYGPCIFYLVVNGNLDNLLKENIETDRVEDAIWAITLYGTVNKEDVSSKANHELEMLQYFIQQHSKKKDELQLLFNAYKAKISPKRKAVDQ